MTFGEWLALVRFGLQILSAAAVVMSPVLVVGWLGVRAIERRGK